MIMAGIKYYVKHREYPNVHTFTIVYSETFQESYNTYENIRYNMLESNTPSETDYVELGMIVNEMMICKFLWYNK